MWIDKLTDKNEDDVPVAPEGHLVNYVIKKERVYISTLLPSCGQKKYCRKTRIRPIIC